MVIPVALYACEIWGSSILGKISSFEIFKKKFFSLVNKMELLQLKFFKRILGVHSKSTNLAVYGELGKTPLIVQISMIITKYWIRVSSLEYSNTLVGKAASCNLRYNCQSVSFANCVLKLCNLNTVNDIVNINIHNLGKYVKTKLQETFKVYWKNQIQQSDGKLMRVYASIKKNFGFKEYLHQISNVKHRQAITKLRISAHKLPVESDRYNNIPYDKRKGTTVYVTQMRSVMNTIT